MLTIVAPRLVSALLLAPALQQQAIFTPELVAGLRTVSSAVLAPDGARAAYTLSVPRKAGADEDGPAWSELWVVDVASGRERAFVSGKVNVSAPAWTADGREIAFLCKRGDDAEMALYLIPVDGGEARRALALGGAIESYDLASDGKRVACIAGPAKDEAREKLRKQGFAQEVYEEDGRTSELWVAALDGSVAPRKLAFEGHPREVHWSPVDERLLVSWAPTPKIDDDYMRKRVAVIDGASGTVRARIENPGKLGEIGWSPDGAAVAMLAAGDRNDPSAGRLCLAPATGGAPVELLPGFEGDALDFAWQGPGALLVVTHVGVWSRLEKLELEQGRARPARTLADAGGPILTSLALARDGQSAVFVASSPAHPSEVFHVRHGESAPRRLTDSNPELAALRFARQEALEHAARDGLELEGVLIHPLERAGSERVPLILNVHGGPESHVSNGWLTGYNNPGQVAAARGFAVFQPNYRGSTGRGVAFCKLGQGDAAGKEFDDLVDAVDHLIAIGLVDGERVGVTGGSYGGYATAWCATRFSERFAAGVMMVGISDKISKVGTTDIPEEEFLVHALERPWDDWQGMLERSPIYHAAESTTPLLILHGKEDPRVNPGQSRELYRHLKLRGQAPVRLVLYPGEGHGNRKAAARLDYALRSLQWFEHYLKGPAAGARTREMPPFEIDPFPETPAAGGASPATAQGASGS
jgi:dipeptidyl aminopeptidase/acylaminoacyl peptidase